MKCGAEVLKQALLRRLILTRFFRLRVSWQELYQVVFPEKRIPVIFISGNFLKSVIIPGLNQNLD